MQPPAPIGEQDEVGSSRPPSATSTGRWARSLAAQDQALLQRAAAWSPTLGITQLADGGLQNLAKAEGLEWATAVLYDRLCRVPHNDAFLRQVESGEAGPIEPPPLVGIVPGAFYLEHQNTGADGARVSQIAADLGCPAELIPVKSFGNFSQNAQIILDWLSRHPAQRLALISLSKGSADLKYALAASNASSAFQNVTAWISFSGLVQGTALVAWLRNRPLRWLGVRLLLRLRGHRPSVLEELRHHHDSPLAFWAPIPSHLRIVHILGFPLRRHLAHRWAPRAYERLAPLGPNDGGGILLADAMSLPGIVIPVWGADHYLEPAWDSGPLLRAILRAAMAPLAPS